MYKSFVDPDFPNRTEFRIHLKHALSTTILGPSLIYDLTRVVKTIHSKYYFILQKEKFCDQNFLDKSSRFGHGTWPLPSLHNLYYFRYTIHMYDFIIVNSNENKGKFFSIVVMIKYKTAKSF